MDALSTAIRHLNRPEELLLESLGCLLVKLLVGRTQACEPEPDLLDRFGRNLRPKLALGFGKREPQAAPESVSRAIGP